MQTLRYVHQSSPLAPRPTRSNAAREIAVMPARCSSSPASSSRNLGNDPMEADVMALTLGQGRERLRGRTDPLAQLQDPPQTRDRPITVSAGVVELSASPARKVG